MREIEEVGYSHRASSYSEMQRCSKVSAKAVKSLSGKIDKHTEEGY